MLVIEYLMIYEPHVQMYGSCIFCAPVLAKCFFRSYMHMILYQHMSTQFLGSVRKCDIIIYFVVFFFLKIHYFILCSSIAV